MIRAPHDRGRRFPRRRIEAQGRGVKHCVGLVQLECGLTHSIWLQILWCSIITPLGTPSSGCIEHVGQISGSGFQSGRWRTFIWPYFHDSSSSTTTLQDCLENLSANRRSVSSTRG